MTPLCLTSHSLIHPQILLILLFKYILNMSTLYLLCCSRPGSIHESLWPDSLKELVCVPSPPSPHFSLLSAPQPEDPAESASAQVTFLLKTLQWFFVLSPRLKIRVLSTTVKLCRICIAPAPCASSFFDLTPASLPLALWLLLWCTRRAPSPGLLCCCSAASARLLPSLLCVLIPFHASPSHEVFLATCISSFSTLPIPFLLYFFFLLNLNSV